MGAYDEWAGRVQHDSDTATAAPARLLAATLDRDEIDFAPGGALPPVWHWLYFLPVVRTRDMAVDGHPPRGGFLPPVPLPRRMRAGGAFRFEKPIRIGDKLNAYHLIDTGLGVQMIDPMYLMGKTIEAIDKCKKSDSTACMLTAPEQEGNDDDEHQE